MKQCEQFHIQKNIKGTLFLFTRQVEKVQRNKEFFTFTTFKKIKDRDGVILQFFSQCPMEQPVKAMLMDIRPFIEKNSAINLGKILNILFLNTEDQKLKQKIKQYQKKKNIIISKNQWNHYEERIKIENGRIIIAKVDMDDWLNANFFHLDKRKLNNLIKEKSKTVQIWSYMSFLTRIKELATIVISLEEDVVNRLVFQ